MPFSVTDPPDYIPDQVFGYQSVNVLFDNDVAMHGSIDTEHDFATGIHSTPKVASVEGLIDYTAGYGLIRGTNISSVDVIGLGAGQCRVNFAVTFASQDFAPFVSSDAAGHIAGWQWDGAALDSVIVDIEDNDGTATDTGFSFTAHGVVQ